MTALNFSSQFEFFKIRSNAVWFEDLPILSAMVKRSSTNLSGIYEFTLPNPNGLALSKFSHYENQELWIAHTPTQTMYRAITGQVNSINPSSKFTVTFNGRGLTGLLTDAKVSDTWDSRRVDHILCDPTFGAIPLNKPEITTWNAFTDDFDKFDYWNADRWGVQPSYCAIYDTELELAGAVGATRTVTGEDGYNYETIEFRAKVSGASHAMNLGFTTADRTQYVQFSLDLAAVNCQTSDSITPHTQATLSSITQTDYHYYRIEWDNGSARFFVDGELEATMSADIPAGVMVPFFEADTTGEILTLDYVKIIILTNLLDRYTANDKPLMEMTSELSDIGTNANAFSFYVDDYRDLNDFVKNSLPSGYSYGLNSSIYTAREQAAMSIEINQESKDLYNSVKIKGGEYLTIVSAPTWTDQFVGDGTTTTFALGYKANKPLTLLQVGGVTKTEDTDFTVSYGTDNTIVKFGTAPALSSAINVRYDYFLPIVATASDEASIAQYGVTRQYSKTDQNISSQNRASEYARSLLLYFSDPRVVIKLKIPLDPRLQVGTTVMVDSPDYGIITSSYEIIEIEHRIGARVWQTTLTLASTEINTSAEIIREILQQLKDLKNIGDTNAVVTDEKRMGDNMGLAELLENKTRYICDSFILGHSENGIIGRLHKRLSDFESSAAWTPSGLTLSDNTDTDFIWVNTSSTKADWAAAASTTLTNTTAQGDLSAIVGASSGTPAKGTIGLWVFLDSGTIGTPTLKIGKDSGNYHLFSSVGYASLPIATGWNYLLFHMTTPTSETGTNDWTDINYLQIGITTTSATGTIYLNYMTLSESDAIGLNGMGYRYIDSAYVSIATG